MDVESNFQPLFDLLKMNMKAGIGISALKPQAIHRKNEPKKPAFRYAKRTLENAANVLKIIVYAKVVRRAGCVPGHWKRIQ